MQLDLLFHLFGRLSTYVHMVHKLHGGVKEKYESDIHKEIWRKGGYWLPRTSGIRNNAEIHRSISYIF
jgi:hypothetical protein